MSRRLHLTIGLGGVRLAGAAGCARLMPATTQTITAPRTSLPRPPRTDATGGSSAPTAGEAARILAAVARETRSYTDPRAEYPLARAAREALRAGAARRRPVVTSGPGSTVEP